MPDSVSSSTPDRILEASLRLFNERGLANVSALKIAIHLGMSQSNLAYHFKTKNDIVLAVFVRIEDEVRKVLLEIMRPGQPFLPVDAAVRQSEVMRVLWRYRFFFNSLIQLLTNDPVLRERYMRMQDSIVESVAQVFVELIEQGFMFKVPKPSTPRMVAKTCWMMWLSWLRFEQIEHPERDDVRDEAIYDGIMQVFTILQHYFRPSFEREMLKELRRATLDKSTVKSAARSGIKSKASAARLAEKRAIKKIAG